LPPLHLSRSPLPPHLPSFPTRRSSDLNRKLNFTVAFNYGGRAEIVDAVRDIVASGVAADKVSEKTIQRHLYLPEMPDPDLVIRRSEEHTSELQSLRHLVCRLLLEKKKH